MKKFTFAPKRQVGVKVFKWGIYFHLRWKLDYYHIKFSAWKQAGLRVSTRRQLKVGRKRRYVDVFRFQISIWATTSGVQRKPRVYGFMFYGGKTP